MPSVVRLDVCGTVVIDAERADVDAAIQYAEFEMAALQGRLAGLQFRKAELARFSLG